MKKILMLVFIVTTTSLVAGCGFSNCGYSSCTVCSGAYSTTSCCGSMGWY